MKNNVVAINVPEITINIKARHKKFIKDVGNFANMISDDYELVLTRLSSRISRVLECFVESGVISLATPISPLYSYGTNIRVFHLTKKEFSSSIFVSTNGSSILISRHQFCFNESWIGVGDDKAECISNVDVDKFDGIEFSNILLNYIHKSIYMRKQAYEKSLFKSNPIQEK